MAHSHTPGPWRVESPGIADEGTRTILLPNGNACARMSSGGNGQELKANAALIAAAPELLAALEALLTRRYITQDDWDSARTAVAKAKGK